MAAEKPPLPPKPKPALPPRPRPPPNAAARPAPPAPANGATRPAPPFKKPALAPPPPPPLKPPPARQYHLHHQHPPPPGGARKPAARYRQQQHRRGGGGCSCRRACCVAAGVAVLALCLSLAAACLAYLYYRPRPPSFHLQPLDPVRLRLLGNSSAAAPALDATVGARAVSWNPNERVAFRYGGGEGRVALADADGDVALGWAPVAGFEHAPRSAAAVAFVAAARGVVVDEAVAARVRDRYRRRQQGFRVEVDTHVGVRVGALRTGMVPVRLVCGGGVMAPRGAGTAAGPLSRCQVYLFRVRW